jgi:hypothetical protein
MGTFEQQFEWQAKFVDQVVGLVAPSIINVSSAHVDRNENGDFEISFPRNGTIGCRLRKPDQSRFVGDVTFRSHSRFGGKTEISKIIDGYGDFFFYGHVNEQDVIWHWYLIDYTKLRALFVRRPGLLRRDPICNRDGSKFLVYRAEDELASAVLAKSEHRLAVAS